METKGNKLVLKHDYVYDKAAMVIKDPVRRQRLRWALVVLAPVFIGLNMIADVLSILSNPRLRHPR